LAPNTPDREHAQPASRLGDAGARLKHKTERKHFFSEEKKQKTFVF
jgi:hypothetical protein